MTFYKIQFKMFKADAKKYKVFILCNLASIAILYSFISISMDQQFMNTSIVDPLISGNIYAPTFFMLMFMGIFIPYSQNVFMKARQKDYGILLSLGMTENEVMKNVLIENLVLYIVSLIIGLILGTVFSIFFLGFVRNVIGIYNINVNISILSYGITTIYVSLIFIISLVINVYSMVKRTIYDKIKYSEKAEKGSHYNIIFSSIGIIITIFAFVIIIIFHDVYPNIWLISLLLCIIGSFLIFFNGESLIEHFQNKYYKKYLKNIFLSSDIKYYYGKNKKIFFVNTWLIFGVLFFIEISLVHYPNFINNSTIYHPFHMAYTEIENSFKPLADNEIKYIAQKNSNNITTQDTVKFVRNNIFTIFCVDDVNRLLKKNYKVQSKSFIYVHPYDTNDGFKHDDINANIPSISIGSNKGAKEFVIQNTLINPLFGQINCISQNIILVNKEDFQWIKTNGIDYDLKGNLHLYNFSNWHNSNIVVNEISNKLFKKNNIKSIDDFYKISSRIDAYNTALKSCNFMIFIFVYMCSLLYFSSIIMIHYKFKMEYKDEKNKYFSLYRIGIGEIEIKKIISQKMLVLYFSYFIYAIIINIILSYYIFSSHGYGVIGILVTVITSLIFLLLHLIVYKVYFNIYYKKIISELNLN